MKRLARTLLFLTIAAVLAAPVMAEDGKKKKKKKKRQQRGFFAFRLPKKLQESLSPEQKKKIGALRKEYTPKFQVIGKKRLGVVSREKQREANKARQEARKAKKNRREQQRAYLTALDLTGEQKEKYQALQKEQRALTQEVRGKIAELLDDDQKKLLRPTRRRGKKKRKKKKDAAE